MQITIRRAAVKDKAALSVVAKQIFYDTFTGTCTKEDMENALHEFYDEEVLEKELANEDDYCFLAEKEDGTLIGYMRFREDHEIFPVMNQWKSIELKRIYILKEYQGEGIAQQLMDYFLKFTRERQYEAVWLGVWEYNIRAQKFYEKYGFEFSGHTHDFPIGNTPQTDVWFWKFYK